MNLFTISGCDKVIHSAVVEERIRLLQRKRKTKRKKQFRKQSLNRCRLRKPTRQPSSPI